SARRVRAVLPPPRRSPRARPRATTAARVVTVRRPAEGPPPAAGAPRGVRPGHSSDPVLLVFFAGFVLRFLSSFSPGLPFSVGGLVLRLLLGEFGLRDPAVLDVVLNLVVAEQGPRPVGQREQERRHRERDDDRRQRERLRERIHHLLDERRAHERRLTGRTAR